MFDIGFMELLLIAVITLVVMGPQRLPQTMRTITLWLGRARQAFAAARKELENEVGMDDVKRQLHNEQIMRDLKSGKSEFEKMMESPFSEEDTPHKNNDNDNEASDTPSSGSVENSGDHPK